MNAVNPSPDDQHIDRLLAEQEASGVLDSSVDPSLGTLGAELETLANQLRQPAPPEQYQEESACARAIEMACRIGREAASESNSSIQANAVEPSELGDVGPYKLLMLLGQGGMGAVYKALHPRLDKIVALKVLPPGRLKRNDNLNRFQREMKAVGKLDHPHLVRALDAGDADGSHYLVMEYVAGIDLSDLLKLRGPLPIAEACELVLQAATGLHAAHSRGMVHRDIKPANLMLARQEFGPPIVKVLDLGLALLADAEAEDAGAGLTSDGQIMGTIDYMAPEQANNSHDVDIRADIYSLGTTLYALLTGGSVFQGRPHKTAMQKLVALSTEETPPIRDRRPDVSAGLSDVIHRMLAKHPQDRFATPADVIAALKPFAAGADLSSLLDEPQDAAGGIVVLDPQAKVSDVTELLTVRLPSTSDAHPKLVEAAESQGPRSGRRGTLIAALLGGVALLGVILFSIRTQNGDVIVEIPEDLPADVKKEIKITVTGNGVTEVASAANGWKVGIAEGKYNVELTGGGDQVQMEDKKVTVSRNKQTIVTITTKPREAMASNPSDPDRSAAEWLRSIGSGPEIGVTIDGSFKMVSDNEPLPEKPFLVRYVLLTGPGIDQLGDRLADEVATRMKGIRVNLDLFLRSKTLTTAGFGKLVALPEFSEAIGVNFDCPQADDGVFEHLAKLPNLMRFELTTPPTTDSPAFTGKGVGALKACPKLAEICWINGSPSTQAFEELSQLPQLNSLRLNSIDCTEQHATALAKLSLRAFHVHASRVDDAVIRQLSAMRKLETLDLSNNPVTDKALAELKPIKTLMQLKLVATNVTAAGIADLQKALPNCKIESDVADPGYKFALWLKSLPPPVTFDVTLADGSYYRVGPEQSLPEKLLGVQAVFLQGPVLDQPGHAFAEEFAKRVKGTTLGMLQVGSPTLTTEQAGQFLQLPEMSDLKVVSLGSEEIDDRIVESLVRLKKVKDLQLRCPKMTGKGLSQLRELTSLSNFNASTVTEESFAELTDLPKLVYLSIGNLRFTERHVAAIAKLKLETLGTHEAGIDDASLAHLSRIVTLQALGLRKSPITDAGLPELKKLQNLTTLHLQETKVTAAGVADLQQALPKCKIEWDAPDPDRRATEWLLSLKHPPKLDLGKDGNPWLTLQPEQPLPAEKFHLYFIQFDKPEHEELGDEFVDELAKHLSGAKQLARFQFPGRMLTAVGLAKLVRLPELADVQELQISPETMDDAMVADLAVMKKLNQLSISRAPKISGKNLGLLKGVVNLHLMECPNLTPAGLTELQQLPLEYLHIGNLRLTEERGSALARHKTLKRLHSQGIDDSTVAGLANMESLVWLGFENSQLTDKGLQELKKFKGLKALVGTPHISVHGSKVTAAGVADLKQALPNCIIE